MRTHHWVTALFLLAVAWPSPAEAQENGTLRGRAINSTDGGGPVAGAAIPLALVYPLWQRWQARSEITETEAGVDETRESLLQRVADLDDAFEAGEIPETAYRVERAVLRKRLLALWDQVSVAEGESELSGVAQNAYLSRD